MADGYLSSLQFVYDLWLIFIIAGTLLWMFGLAMMIVSERRSRRRSYSRDAVDKAMRELEK